MRAPPPAGRRRALGSFPAFVFLQGSLYAAYGMVSPFLPSLLGERGLTASEIGIVLAAGTLARLVAGPLAGRAADRLDATRAVLGCGAASAGFLAFATLFGHGFPSLLALGLAQAVALAALAPLADALTLAAVTREGAFAYGWVRGAGSAAFILATLVSGQCVAWAGLGSILVTSGLLFLLTALAASRVPAAPRPERPAPRAGEAQDRTLPEHDLPGHDLPEQDLPEHDLRALLAAPLFRRVLLVAALVIGSHAVHEAFAVIRWRAAGLGPGTISLLWSLAVLSEVAVFVLFGSGLLARLGTAGAAMLAAGCGVLRWAIMASTVAVPLLALAQALHGFTFALLHLANMRLIAGLVPERAAATAQTLYATLGLGLANTVLTGLAGWLYGRFGADTFWSMAALCACALPLAAGLRARAGHTGSR
ncbi:MFS transporter [Methylobacterium sp. J-068]|uniref:MFS transporter n=1 Tax=Methylobacterium sp. J-068 TaxID=2836649 RepID=UPI001FB9742F|nr:MFS transporter [Methylobacterium sp. J-068]MCJ2036118.1 MFS transporter [Methylobacterium sp. J-068]